MIDNKGYINKAIHYVNKNDLVNAYNQLYKVYFDDPLRNDDWFHWVSDLSLSTDVYEHYRKVLIAGQEKRANKMVSGIKKEILQPGIGINVYKFDFERGQYIHATQNDFMTFLDIFADIVD